MKRLGVFLLPVDGMLVHRRVTPRSKLAGTHLYTCVERGTVRVKCLAQEHNAVPWPRLEAGSLDPEATVPPTEIHRPDMCFRKRNLLPAGAGMAQWWSRSLPTDVARVRFRSLSQGRVCCWFSHCSKGYSLGCPVFLAQQKRTLSSTWIQTCMKYGFLSKDSFGF